MRSLGAFEFLILLAMAGFVLFAFSNIFAKAGYTRLLALALLVPGANVLVVMWFAFARWPLIEELERRRARQASRT